MTVRPASVIVCTHNRAHLLPNVIARLRAQDYPAEAFEIIVVDNHSSDLTPQTVKQFVTEPGADVRYMAENRVGITFARNRGAEEARHPYLVYLDDDCSVEPDWLSNLIRGFDLRNDVVAAGGRVVLDWSQAPRPSWLGPRLESWLGANGHLGFQPLLLDAKTQIMESNMALKREAWRAAGGFLGMEQFGSRHVSAGEVLYLLQKLRSQGGQIAFVPQAIAVHLMGTYTRSRFLRRAYWQGVSDAMLDSLLSRQSWAAGLLSITSDSAAMLVFIGCTAFSYLASDQSDAFLHFVRAVRRLGLVLSRIHLAGDWSRVRSWHSSHHQPGSP